MRTGAPPAGSTRPTLAPGQPAILEDYIGAFGHRARRSLVQFLQDNGFSLRVDIATATDLPHLTRGHHLAALDRLEVIIGSGR